MSLSDAKHDELRRNLAGFAAGRLSAEEQRAVEIHLAGCPDCADLARTIGQIATVARAQGQELSTPHPNVAQIRRYALDRMRDGAASEVDDHMRVCPSCALEVAAWRARVTRRRPRAWVLGAAGGAALAAGLLVWLWVRPVAAQVLVFSVAQRGESAEQVVDPGPTQPLTVRVHWESLEPPAGLGPLDVEILTLDGRRVWNAVVDAERVAQTLDAAEGLTLEIPAATLSEGRYEWRVSRTARPGEPPLIQERFRVR